MSFDEKLNNVVAKHEELQNILATRTDLEGQEVARISKELADLTDIVRVVTEYRLTEAELADLTSLIEDPRSDKDVRELAAEELRDLKQKLPEYEREMQLLLLPKDAADEKNAILEVRAGTGGDEAALLQQIWSACTSGLPSNTTGDLNSWTSTRRVWVGIKKRRR